MSQKSVPFNVILYLSPSGANRRNCQKCGGEGNKLPAIFLKLIIHNTLIVGIYIYVFHFVSSVVHGIYILHGNSFSLNSNFRPQSFLK